MTTLFDSDLHPDSPLQSADAIMMLARMGIPLQLCIEGGSAWATIHPTHFRPEGTPSRLWSGLRTHSTKLRIRRKP